MSRGYLDFDIALTSAGQGYSAHVLHSPAGEASAPFALPFSPTELAQFMVAVGPPRVASRRLVPAADRVLDVEGYGRRLAAALLAGDVGRAFRDSLATATAKGEDLRLRLRLDAVPDLEPVPWEYLYDERLERFITLSQETPVVRLLDAVERPPVVPVEPPLRVLVMVSSPSDLPALAVDREKQLLRATTGDLVRAGQLELVVLEDATLTALQRALIDDFHVFHFIGHGGFDEQAQEGVLVLEREDGTAHRVSGARLGTLLHDARLMQLAVLNACEGARTSGRDAFSGVGQALVRQGLPAVVAMQTEISDRAALVFSHEFYWFLTRGLGIDAAMCEVRKAMAVSDEAAEWGTAVLLRSDTEQPFTFAPSAAPAARDDRLEALYAAAQDALAAQDSDTALPMLEQIAVERPGYADVSELIERVRPGESPTPPVQAPPTGPAPLVGTDHPTTGAAPGSGDASGTGPPAPAPQTPPNPERHGVGRWVVVGLALAAVVAGWFAWRSMGSHETTGGTTASTVTCASGVGTVPNADFTIGCAAKPPAIDAVDAAADGAWAGAPAHDATAAVFGADAAQDGFAASWRALWDEEALYLYADVRDPTHTPVDAGQPPLWWRGDAVSFEIGPDPRGLAPTAHLRDGRDFHVILALLPDHTGAADVNVPGQDSKGRWVFTAGSRRPGIRVAARVVDSGYVIEARVPWTEVGWSTAPVRGEVLGMNVNVSDAAGTGSKWRLRTMLSSNPERDSTVQNLPARWQTVALGPAG